MTWHESRLAALLMAEEVVGHRERVEQAAEDAQMNASIRAIEQHQR